MLYYIIFSKYHIFKGDILQKFFSLMIMLAVFCLVAPVAGQAVFRDLPKTYTFYDDIKYLTEKEIITGFPSEMFIADQNVTRQQAAIMIGRALELNEEPRDTKFSDVNVQATGFWSLPQPSKRESLPASQITPTVQLNP